MLNTIKSLSSEISGDLKGFEIEHQIFNITYFVFLLFVNQTRRLNYILGTHCLKVVLAFPVCILAFLIYLKSFNSDKLKNNLLITFSVSICVILKPIHFFNGVQMQQFFSYGFKFF